LAHINNNNTVWWWFQPATPNRTLAATPLQPLPTSLTPPKRLDTPILEEPSDLEELEQFAKTFKQRRIKLGFTQVGVGRSVCVSRSVGWVGVCVGGCVRTLFALTYRH